MSKGLLGCIIILLGSASGLFAQGPAAPMAANPMAGGNGYVTEAPAAGWSEACGCPQPSRVWGSAEYLLWWVKDGPLPFPFVLTGPVNGPPPNNNPGALNEGGFPILGKSVEFGALSGVRASVGGWLDAGGTLGIEGSGFLLPQQSKTFRAASDANGNPVLGFRYLDTPASGNGPEDIFQASIPPGNANGVGPFAGSLAVISHTRLWGADVNAVAGLANGGGLRLQALGGFRYVDLSEDLSLQLQSTALDGSTVFFQGNAFPAPSAVATTDLFRTRNQFYGGQLGVRGEFSLGNFIVSSTGKVALGSNHEAVEVQGTSTLFPNPGPTTTVPVGQFAGPSNIGRRTRDEFAVIPEVEVKVGYQVTNWLRATVGYNFLYVSRVVRPGSQVDLFVNDSVNPVNGAFGVAPIDRSALPQPLFNRTDFWAQGITFGLELRY
jgi:hypothetical protein